MSELTSGSQRPDPPSNHPLPPTRVERAVRLVLVMAIVLIVGMTIGIVIGRDIIAQDGSGSQQFTKLDAVRDLIDDNYYYRPDAATAEATWESDLEGGAIDGMLGTLDGYTRYLPPDDAADAQDQLAGAYEGIGITVASEDGTYRITNVVEGGPADQAGVRADDRIVSVNGTTLGESVDVSALIKGPAGSDVTLGIERGDPATSLTITATRAEIVTPQVHYELLAESKVAVITVDIFGDQTTSLVTQFLQQAEADGASGVVLDLRGNGGGWVSSAQEVIGRFVSANDGPALYEDATIEDGGESPMPIVNGDDPLYTGAVVVLVDKNTASAAEIVAGALQDYDRAVIVGQTTYGKGSVQRIYDFTDSSSLRITVAEWLTPNGSRLQGVGITPDVAIAEDDASSDDPELAQAVALIEAGQVSPSDLVDATPASATPQMLATP